MQSSRLVLDILVLTIKHTVFKTNNNIPSIFFRCFSISQQQVNGKKFAFNSKRKEIHRRIFANALLLPTYGLIDSRHHLFLLLMQT